MKAGLVGPVGPSTWTQFPPVKNVDSPFLDDPIYDPKHAKLNLIRKKLEPTPELEPVP